MSLIAEKEIENAHRERMGRVYMWVILGVLLVVGSTVAFVMWTWRTNPPSPCHACFDTLPDCVNPQFPKEVCLDQVEKARAQCLTLCPKDNEPDPDQRQITK